MTDQERAAAAAIVGSWYWQPAEGHNYRWSKAVRSFTRFYESAPMETDELKLVVEYLRTLTDITDIELNHKLYTPGGTWQTKDVWFQTMQGEKWEGTESTKVRIYHTLISKLDGEVDGPYVVKDGCRWKVEHTFYWDVEDFPELPASSSGINYTIQGVTRDRETGLVSCVLEKRERLEQDIALYEETKTIFETRKQAQYLGVKQGDLPTTGEMASAGNGVLVERHLTKNEDCTTNVENVEIDEESVANSTVEVRKTLRGTVKTVVDRNQEAALEESGLEVGELRRSEKTPGGLYNNTTTKTTREAAGKIAESCSKTIFEHEHQEVENVASEPSEASVSSASGGVIHSRSVRKTEEGTFDVTDGTRVEESVDNAVVEFRKTVLGTVKTTVDRNQEEALDESGLEVGETRRSEKTPGGLYNNTTSRVLYVAAGRIAAMCVKAGGGHMHQHQSVTNVESEPDSSASSAAANYQRQKAIQKTETGWRVENIVTRWLPESESESWADENYLYKHKQYINSLQPQKPTGNHDSVSLSFHQNGHGSFDGSWTIRDGGPVTPGQTLQWSIGPKDIEVEFKYLSRSGKLMSRTVKGKKYMCGGKLPHVANEISHWETDNGYTGFEAAGWRNRVDGTYQHAMGVCWLVVSIGKATPIDDESSGV